MRFGFDWPSGFRELDFITTYIGSGQGQTMPCGQFFINTYIQCNHLMHVVPIN